MRAQRARAAAAMRARPAALMPRPRPTPRRGPDEAAGWLESSPAPESNSDNSELRASRRSLISAAFLKVAGDKFVRLISASLANGPKMSCEKFFAGVWVVKHCRARGGGATVGH